MHPTLVHIGPFPLHATASCWRSASSRHPAGEPARAGARTAPDVVFDTSLVIVFAAILGARGAVRLFHRNEMHRLLDVIALWSGGLTMYGGVLAAMVGRRGIYLRRRRVRVPAMADVVAPSLGLGLGLTRIGCFLNGCCYGKPTTGPVRGAFPARFVRRPPVRCGGGAPDAVVLVVDRAR